MKRVGLSVDFDFFVREEIEWEFGHSENQAMFAMAAWTARYLHLDLVKECDPYTHADFDPRQLIDRLKDRNMEFLPDFPLGIADSHLYAKTWFECHPVDLIVNFDAHHDAWPIPKAGVDCASWLTAMTTPAICVYPSWKDRMIDPDPARFGLDRTGWKAFGFDDPVLVTCAFLCRSSAWVPPHLDGLFGELVETLVPISSPQQLQAVPVRPEINLKAMKKYRGELQRWQKKLMAKARKEKESSEQKE